MLFLIKWCCLLKHPVIQSPWWTCHTDFPILVSWSCTLQSIKMTGYSVKLLWDIQVCIYTTGTCFIQKIYAPSSSLLQGKHLPFTPSPLRLNIFRLFVILSLTQLYRYTPEIFLFSTATFKYIYRAPLGQIGQ